MTRRNFGKIVMGASAAVLVGAWNVMKKSGPVRFIRAIKGGTFPGKLQALDDATVRKQAEWRG